MKHEEDQRDQEIAKNNDDLMSAISGEEPPDPRTAYKNVKGAFEDVHQLNALPGFFDNDLTTCLLMKYGYCLGHS